MGDVQVTLLRRRALLAALLMQLCNIRETQETAGQRPGACWEPGSPRGGNGDHQQRRQGRQQFVKRHESCRYSQSCAPRWRGARRRPLASGTGRASAAGAIITVSKSGIVLDGTAGRVGAIPVGLVGMSRCSGSCMRFPYTGMLLPQKQQHWIRCVLEVPVRLKPLLPCVRAMRLALHGRCSERV